MQYMAKRQLTKLEAMEKLLQIEDIYSKNAARHVGIYLILSSALLGVFLAPQSIVFKDSLLATIWIILVFSSIILLFINLYAMSKSKRKVYIMTRAIEESLKPSCKKDNAKDFDSFQYVFVFIIFVALAYFVILWCKQLLNVVQ